MNSVISAFKGKKNASNNSNSNSNNVSSTSYASTSSNAVAVGATASSSSNSSNNVSTSSTDPPKSNGHHYPRLYNHNNHNVKKKAISAQDNGYQYLRHIREIDTTNKLLSPVAVTNDMLDGAMLGYRAKQPQLTNNVPAVVACVDVVDHAEVSAMEPFATPISVKTDIGTDCNMNGAKCLQSTSALSAVENGNCNELNLINVPEGTHVLNLKCAVNLASSPSSITPSLLQQYSIADGDDDESEHSTLACTSSSSDHSSSTILHSPTMHMNTISTTTQPLVITTELKNQQQSQMLQPSPVKSLSLSLSNNASSSVSPSKSIASFKSSSSSSLTTSSSIVLSPSSSSSSIGAIFSNSGPSSHSSSTSCNVTTIAGASNGSIPSPTPSTLSINNASSSCGTVTPPSQSSSPTPIVNSNNAPDYVPSFLKMTPITLPIRMPNGKGSFTSAPSLQQHLQQQIQDPHINNSSTSTSRTDGQINLSSAATTPKHARFSKPRLSLSRFMNHSMPSVHGRPNLSIASNCGDASDCNTLTNPPKRISTHQRNLSLDFRSMGILLPPVSQVTNTRINLTQHHRNRSLDSALQRIPEVEVSSPNAESENTFCTPSLLGTTMCSKIVTTAANVTAALTTTTTPALGLPSASSSLSPSSYVRKDADDVVDDGALDDEHYPPSSTLMFASSSSSMTTVSQPTMNAEVNQPNAAKPEVFVETCTAFRARPKSSESSTTVNSRCNGSMSSFVGSGVSNTGSSVDINGKNRNKGDNCSGNGNTSGNSKKREDLTSLGSDDSGIICGSDSDQISLNRVCHSHESLDSGEMDAEEECIDMLETTSMDEEYGMLQSDLCFYQTSDIDCRTLRPSRKSKQKQKQQQQQEQQQQQQHKDNNEEASGSGSTSSEAGGGGDGNATPDLNERARYREMNMCQVALRIERSSRCSTPTPTSTPKVDVVDAACTSKISLTTTKDAVTSAAVSTSTTSPPTPSTPLTPVASTAPITAPTSSLKLQKSNEVATESTKNDVLFKNFFGATKNAIFRTAQSIIDNHEKKNAAKNKMEDSSGGGGGGASGGGTAQQDQIKSPVDISKKKEFFGLITSNASKKAAAAAAAAAAIAAAANTTALTPKIDSPEQSDTLDKTAVSADPNTELTERTLNLHLTGGGGGSASNNSVASMSKSSSISSLNKLKAVPGVVKCFIKERPGASETQNKTEKGPNGLLRFFESPVFNIHFAVHYLFYSKEPGVLSFIGNKIFNFRDQEVDLYIPQLIVMYIQMDELAEVLDPYLTIRCRKSVDFSLKCLWLLEAYNYQVDSLGSTGRKSQLALMKEIFSKKERKVLSCANKPESKDDPLTTLSTSVTGASIPKKTHHRSQSDATVLLAGSLRYPVANTLSLSNSPAYLNQLLPPTTTPARLCLGDLTSGRAFDNGCTCFESVRGQVNGLLGQKTVCTCGAPKTAPEKEFMKALINVGKNLTSLPSKAEKTSALRMFLNLINKNLPARVWLPLYSDIPHHVVRITEEKTAVLNSKDKTPYIIYVEVVEVPDIYSSPLIPKMMPSLRHTKSEEFLEGVGGSTASHNVCSRTSSCSSHGGSGSGSGSASGTASNCRQRKEKLISESSSSVASESGAGINSTTNDVHSCCNQTAISFGGLHLTEDDVWSQEDDDITAQYLNMRKIRERDAISQMSLDSCDSRDQGLPVLFNIGDVRSRHCNNLSCENTKSFSNDPEDPSAAALKEPWHEKEKQIRDSSPYGHLSNWRLLSAIVKCGDDLRQELMATQLLEMFKIIWHEENVDLWVRPYKIVCLSNDSGLIEPILNTVSLHQIKKNSNKSLRDYFIDEYGEPESEEFRLAQRNFVQSCAAYCLISYLLQVKDRHNGNILLHSDGHIIHIDFGFILSISPKNLGFEQSPFKLTHEFVDVMGGTNSEHWRDFNRLLLVGMMSARKHMDRIINFVEIMRSNAQLPCFKNGCSGTVQNLRKRFHMNLTEQEMERKVEQLVQDSLKSLSTKLYDGYQYYTNGIL